MKSNSIPDDSQKPEIAKGEKNQTQSFPFKRLMDCKTVFTPLYQAFFCNAESIDLIKKHHEKTKV